MRNQYLIRLMYLALLALLPLSGSASGAALRDYHQTLLYRLEAGVESGDLQSLYAVGAFLDSTGTVIDHLGYHRDEVPLNSIAGRIIAEHTLFLPSELRLDSSPGAASFQAFLNRNRDRIRFSKLSSTFLITPEAARVSRYRLVKITRVRELEIGRALLGAATDTAENRQTQDILDSRNPEVLLYLASELFRHRDRWDDYHSAEDWYTGLLAQLTGIELLVADESGQLVALRHARHGADRLGYLAYWAAHYRDYVWSEQVHRFINSREKAQAQRAEVADVELLSGEDAQAAREAFYRLTEAAPETLRGLLRTQESQNFADGIPMFGDDILIALSKLTQYCRAHQIPYSQNRMILGRLELLRDGDLSLTDREQIERWLVRTMELRQVTALEYETLRQENGLAGPSVEKVLDRLYTKHWQELITDTFELKLFLKKAAVFSRGSLDFPYRNYAGKFWRAPEAVLRIIEHIGRTETDADFRAAAIRVAALQTARIKPVLHETWRPEDLRLAHFADSIRAAGLRLPDDEIRERYDIRMRLDRILAGLDYADIPTALQVLKGIPDSLYQRMEFLRADFGFPIMDQTDATIEGFLMAYRRLDRAALYEYYLRRAGADVWDDSGRLDFMKTFDLLRYDIPTGSASYDSEGIRIYPVVWMLERRFGTRLGFPEKRRQNSGTDPYLAARSKAWQKYLLDKGFVSPKSVLPASFKIDLVGNDD